MTVLEIVLLSLWGVFIGVLTILWFVFSLLPEKEIVFLDKCNYRREYLCIGNKLFYIEYFDNLYIYIIKNDCFIRYARTCVRGSDKLYGVRR